MSKNNTVHIIYVSGFGGRYDSSRRFLLKFWRLYNVSTELVSMSWSDGLSYDSKLKKLNQAIDRSMDKKIVLIGESAGASIAINAYAARETDIYRVITLCGKNSGADTVADHLYIKNPAFKDSIRLADRNIKRLSKEQARHFTSMYPLHDPVIPAHESIVPGSREVRLWTLGHLISILLALSCLSFILVREAKR
jgi:hypothetical protein